MERGNDNLTLAGGGPEKDLIGETLAGGYRVVRQIEVDALSGIYQATRADGSGGKFIAAVVHGRHADDETRRRRLERSAATLKSLTDENIAPVVDVGRTDDGRPFVIYQHPPGEPLADLLDDKGKMELGPAVRMVRRVCQALAAAHLKRVVHHDVRPQNIYLYGDPQRHRCKVLGFGLWEFKDASVLSPAGSGMSVATASYAAPEQVRGDIADHRADIYSVGALLFSALTGRPPVDPLSGATIPKPRSVNPTISEAVEAVILRAMAPDPADRFRYMNELDVELMPHDDAESDLLEEMLGEFDAAFDLESSDEDRHTPPRPIKVRVRSPMEDKPGAARASAEPPQPAIPTAPTMPRAGAPQPTGSRRPFAPRGQPLRPGPDASETTPTERPPQPTYEEEPTPPKGTPRPELPNFFDDVEAPTPPKGMAAVALKPPKASAPKLASLPRPPSRPGVPRPPTALDEGSAPGSDRDAADSDPGDLGSLPAPPPWLAGGQEPSSAAAAATSSSDGAPSAPMLDDGVPEEEDDEDQLPTMMAMPKGLAALVAEVEEERAGRKEEASEADAVPSAPGSDAAPSTPDSDAAPSAPDADAVPSAPGSDRPPSSSAPSPARSERPAAPADRRKSNLLLYVGVAAVAVVALVLLLRQGDETEPARAAPTVATTAPAHPTAASAAPSATGQARSDEELVEQLRDSVARKQLGPAVSALEQIAERDYRLLDDERGRATLVDLLMHASQLEGETADRPYDLAAEQLGPLGPDVLFELYTTRGGSEAAKRAWKLLGDEPVRELGTPALRVAYELRAAVNCDAVVALLHRAKADGDLRAKRELERVRDCRAGTTCCMRNNRQVDTVIRAIGHRLGQEQEDAGADAGEPDAATAASAPTAEQVTAPPGPGKVPTAPATAKPPATVPKPPATAPKPPPGGKPTPPAEPDESPYE